MSRRRRKGGLFRRLFGKRKGGSPAGNFLRRIGDSLTGGVVSDLIPPAKEDGKWIAEMRSQGVKLKDISVKVGGIKSHVSDEELAEMVNKSSGKNNKETMWSKIQYYVVKKPVAAILTVATIGYGVYYFFFKKRRKSW